MKKNIYYNNYAFFITLTIILTIFIKLSFWWNQLNKKMLLEKILLSETYIIDKEKYYDLLKEFIGTNMHTVNIDNMTKIIEEHPYIKTTRISKWYPSTVKIEIIERDPIALLNITPMVLIDSDGYVMPDIESKKNLNLPIMTNFNSDISLYPFGKKVLSINVEKSALWLNKIKNGFPSLYENISEMKMTSDNNINMILSDYPTHIYLGQKNIWPKIKILKKFENELFPKKLSNFSYLDMRYKNQIIAMNRKI
ncbi:MAG: hypothetical protein CMG55_08600 [Candidatus Marinimicrobia bacterium]|nr:hypothetical protein [Candidatus Neomarinimicrobiota bacterium]